MYREEVKKWFRDQNKKPQHLLLSLKYKNQQVYDLIKEITNYLPEETKLSERIFHILNNLFEIQKCKECGIEPVLFLSITRGYQTFCSVKCRNKSSEVKERKKETFKKNYGTSHYFLTEEFKKRKKDRIKEKYGVEHQMLSEAIKNKTRETNLKKYGTEYPQQNKEVREKTRNTNIIKYGVENSISSDTVRKKIKKTLKEKYGVSHQIHIPEVRKKIQKTNLKKYNTIYPITLEQTREKIRKTNQKKYGVIFPQSLRETKEKTKNTNLRKYGTTNFMKTELEEKKLCIERMKSTYKKAVMERMEKKGFSLVNPDDYKNVLMFIEFRCKKCNTVFNARWASLSNGYLCPKCFPRTVSKGEMELREFIKEILPNTKILNNYRYLIYPKEVDIFIPHLKIAIEYNGLYWHSETFIEDNESHLKKTLRCNKEGVQLIQIFEDEWFFKKEIVKERLKQILGLNHDKPKIYARNCEIKEIDSKIKNKFLENFHIQGKDSSSVKLGAFFQGNLISVMTFSKGNISKGLQSEDCVWELNRFCSDYNYRIIGIAGKLLTHFKRNYNWKEIFSYADRRWSGGNVYRKLGFSLASETRINYWYIEESKLNKKRIHRFSLRKKQNEPKEIPEYILRGHEGYLRVWDCGSLKFSMVKKSEGLNNA